MPDAFTLLASSLFRRYSAEVNCISVLPPSANPRYLAGLKAASYNALRQLRVPERHLCSRSVLLIWLPSCLCWFSETRDLISQIICQQQPLAPKNNIYPHNFLCAALGVSPDLWWWRTLAAVLRTATAGRPSTEITQRRVGLNCMSTSIMIFFLTACCITSFLVLCHLLCVLYPSEVSPRRKDSDQPPSARCCSGHTRSHPRRSVSPLHCNVARGGGHRDHGKKMRSN